MGSAPSQGWDNELRMRLIYQREKRHKSGRNYCEIQLGPRKGGRVVWMFSTERVVWKFVPIEVLTIAQIII